MNRQDFIFTLFDNGNGLTLEQIDSIEKNYIPDIIEEDIIDDLINDNGMTRKEAVETLTPDAREIVIDSIAGNRDMLELRDHLNGILFDNMRVSDNQVYSLFFALCNH